MLGMVHRGEPWATLNLKTYNSEAVDSPKNKQITRGGAPYLGVNKEGYYNGDANILDQVTIRTDNESEVYKINANTNSYMTLRGAHENNKIFLTDLMETNGATAGESFINRAELAKNEKYKYKEDYDYQSEQYMPKYVNYFSTRYNYFTVLVQAQSVNDRGDIEVEGVTGTAGVFDEGIDYITAEKKQIIVYQRDAYTNKWKVLSRENID